MGTYNLQVKEMYRHTAIWLCIAFYMYIFGSPDGGLFVKLIFTVTFVLSLTVPYYLLLLYVYPRFFENNKLFFGTLLIAVSVLFLLIDYANNKFILPFFNVHTARETFAPMDSIKVSMLKFLLIGFAATGVYLNRRSLLKIKYSYEREKLEITEELAFLSNQFHSHLTFNFISFCHGQLLRISKKSAESMENFASMLLYSLNTKPGQFISIAQEIEYIENFIEIQRCITTEVYVTFKHEGEHENFKILQGIFSVFVENAFKHGIYSNEKKPIIIILEICDDNLLFEIENQRKIGSKSISNGIGLKNIKEVLEIFYKDSYSLNIFTNDYNYKIKLTIKLDKLCIPDVLI
jgi:hypothetical protein